MQDILDEVVELFPSSYIHLGGDEAPRIRWKNCVHCQERMKQEHLTKEAELQTYFINRIENYLNTKGKKIIGWDEILEGGILQRATVMSWRGEKGGIHAAKPDMMSLCLLIFICILIVSSLRGMEEK